MGKIEWGPEYETGVREIDSQHRTLLGIYNDLSDALELDTAGQAAATTLDRLLHYTDFHFKTEERMMVEHGYPMSSAHTAEHYVLIERSKLLQHRLQGGDQKVAVDTLDFLKRWLINHIQKVDRDLAEYLQSRGVN
ncbi:MAG TPA: bacteriohemerythrin [Rhodocyclaceae bacterium]